ncbi:MAG: RidA family protein [Planctomycetota bacterium]|nr:RidA family protein [Planctomycetota bacterium]
MTRQNISSGTPWEDQVGYSRAVRAGDRIFVTGTIGADAQGTILAPGDPYRQAMDALDKIEQAVTDAGGSLDDLVRTRIYITDMDHADEVGRAHGERLGRVKPCCTMVVVSCLFADALVEIEADAVLVPGT